MPFATFQRPWLALPDWPATLPAGPGAHRADQSLRRGLRRDLEGGVIAGERALHLALRVLLEHQHYRAALLVGGGEGAAVALRDGAGAGEGGDQEDQEAQHGAS